MDPKSWRISQNLTQKQVAEMIGGKTSNGNISEIENGKRAPSGRITRRYFEVSNGEVTPPEFPKQH